MDHASILQKENNDYYLKGPKYQPSTAPREPIYYSSASYPQAPEQLPFNISSQMAPVRKKRQFQCDRWTRRQNVGRVKPFGYD